MKIEFFDQHESHFATFDMETLPRVGDTVEIGFPDSQVTKTFAVEEVIHKMIKIAYNNDPPWRWEYQLHGNLYTPYQKEPCTCAQGVTKCGRHGEQPEEREMCPECKTHVLGYCAQGEYCTSDDCEYIA